MSKTQQHIGRAPADADQDERQGGDHAQLPRAHPSTDDAVGHSCALGIEPGDEHADGRYGGDPVADAEHDPVERDEVPGRACDCDQANADGADEEAGDQNAARTVAVEHPAGEEHEKSGHDVVDPDGGAEHATAEGEFLRHRFQRQSECEPCPRSDEHDQEAGDEHERAQAETVFHVAPAFVPE